MWLTTRRFSATPEEGRSGPQVRVQPAPCCRRTKRGGSLVISTATGLWKCFGCGAKGNWFGLTRLAGDPIPDPYEDAQPVDFRPFDAIRAKMRRPVTQAHHAAVLTYCVNERLIRPETLDAWRVSTKGPESLRWPLFAFVPCEGWKLANARVRRVLNRGDEVGDWFEVKGGPTSLAIGNHLLGVEPHSWGANKPSWAMEWLDPTRLTPEAAQRVGSPFPSVRRVLVVEGQWDAMTAWQLGIPNVLSLPNGAGNVDASGILRYVPDDTEVWVATDMDEAGDRAAEAFFAQLGGRCRRLMLPVKDLNQWLQDSAGTLTAEQVLSTAEGRPVEVTPGDKIDLDDDGEEEVASEIITETPWPRLTRRLDGGFRAGQTTGLLAPSGVGKTTLVNNIIVHAAERGVTSGIVQLESLRSEVRAKLRAQVKGWTGLEEKEDLKPLFARIWLSPLEGKEVTWKQTIDAVEKFARDGAKLLVIDNWDFLGLSGRDMIQAYGAFQGVCRHWGAHGVVVWQPKKIDRHTLVNSGDQKGMSQLLQDADVYITMNRHGNARRLDVEKARVEESDEDLNTVWLKYSKESKCLTETTGQADLLPLPLKPERP